MEKQPTLFDDQETILKINRTETKKERFENYEGFLEKFKAKKTTDDCFTPEPVYLAVVDFVSRHFDIEGRHIVRPFFPGGDYINHEYPENAIVIDNPPFSILSKILRFYTAHDIPFFLFGPSLTLFTALDCDLTYIIADCDITYENGAVVRTGFITNLFDDLRIWCCPELKERIENAQKPTAKQKKGFVYPDNLVTAATLQKITAHGVELKIRKSSARYIHDSAGAKAAGRSIFGGGYLLSTQAAAEHAIAERLAAERTVEAAKTKLTLSPQELAIIEELDRQENNY